MRCDRPHPTTSWVLDSGCFGPAELALGVLKLHPSQGLSPCSPTSLYSRHCLFSISLLFSLLLSFCSFMRIIRSLGFNNLAYTFLPVGRNKRVSSEHPSCLSPSLLLLSQPRASPFLSSLYFSSLPASCFSVICDRRGVLMRILRPLFTCSFLLFGGSVLRSETSPNQTSG